MDLTPASLRPYVGGSTNNSEFNLIFGYNGLGRIFGEAIGRTSSTTAVVAKASTTALTTTSTASTASTAADAVRGPQGGSGGMFGTGNPGILRLVKAQVGAQFAWLLPLVGFGLVATIERKFRLPLSRKAQSVVLWTGWLLTHLIVFSFAQGIFHTYYLTAVAPAIAALAGIGTAALWERYQQRGWRIALLPLAFLATAAYDIYLLWSYTAYRNVLAPIIVIGTIIAVMALLVARFRHQIHHNWVRGAAALGLLTLLVSPAVWSATTLASAGNSVMPSAGPQSAMDNGGPGGGMPPSGAPNATTNGVSASTTNATTAATANVSQNTTQAATTSAVRAGGFNNNQTNTALIAYLVAHQGTTTNLVATMSAQSAENIIIATGKPVMALGGFSGSDQILTTAQLAQLAQNNTVRYFLIESGGMGGPQAAQSSASSMTESTTGTTAAATTTADQANQSGGQFGSNSVLTQWIKQHANLVSQSEWQGTATSTTTSSNGGPSSNVQLYVYTG